MKPSASSEVETLPTQVDHGEEFAPGFKRPHANLMLYYALASLMIGPFFPILLLIGYFRFRSLEYHFDEEGVTMRWGVLFRREISLAYARLQDIHLASNVLERWLGLARVKLQTAAGSAVAEMTIEGLPDFELVRDFLYAKMRGRREASARTLGSKVTDGLASFPAAAVSSQQLEEVVIALREATSELHALRREVSSRRGGQT